MMKYSTILFLFLLLVIAAGLTSTNSAQAIPATTRVSLAHDGQQANKDVMWPDISDNGRYAVFASTADNLLLDWLSGNTTHIFLRDLETGLLTLVSEGTGDVPANGSSYYPVISGDGNFIAFASIATNLVPDDTNNVADIFVYNRLNGSMTRASKADDGSQSNNMSWAPAISDDGSVVTFQSQASNLVVGDTNNVQDIFVHDLLYNETKRVSLTSAGQQADEQSVDPHISGNGRYVVFASFADLMGNGNSATAIYLYNRDAETVERISKKVGFYANDATYDPYISDDGRYVAYQSIDELLVDDDTNGTYDVFLYDRNTDETSRVSIHSDGSEANASSSSLGISGNGRYILFSSDATNLVNDDTNNNHDVFVHDASSGETKRISLAGDGTEGNSGSSGPAALTDDGYTVIYQSSASNFVLNDTNNNIDVFMNESDANEAPITLTITRLTNYSTALDEASPPDFYAKVWISPDDPTDPPLFNNEANHTEDEANVEPFWTFSQPVNQFANRTVIIEVWDKDTDSADDLADIHPALGKDKITLTIDMVTGKWDGDVEWPKNCAVGDQETAVEVCWDISVFSTSGDLDEDGLLDGWENNGFNQNGDTILDVDLPAMGADPRHKDIFVEIDYMATGGSSYRPEPAAISTIVNAFNNAPLSNPDGSSGIHLHVDAGADAPLTWGDAATWGSLSGGNVLPHQQFLGTCVADEYSWTQFDQFKNAHFDERRLPVFHYNIWANRLCPEFGSTSGISRGDGASDFILTLGGWNGVNGTQTQQAGTFMHELGHNLGLKHGGADEVNYKPNYLSIMNYSFQTTGLYVNGQAENFDYSRYTLPALDENDLDETKGISPAPNLTLGTRFFCGSPFPKIDTNAAQVDWNCSGSDTEISVTGNINRGYAPNTNLGVLTSQNDWDNLVYKGGAIGGLGSVYMGDGETAVSELTQEEAATMPSWPETQKVYLPLVMKP